MRDPSRSGGGSDYDFLFKILLIGDSGTGKSSLMTRFVDDSFTDHFISTIGVDFKIKTLNIQDKIVKLQIWAYWDTAGQDRFRAITQSYYHGAHGILIVFDVTNRSSFDHVEYWFGEISQYSNPNVVIGVVGNKIDLANERVVSEAEAQTIADSKSVKYTESSAKMGSCVLDAFTALVNDVMSTMSQPQRRVSVIQPMKGQNIQQSKCC